MKCAAAAAAVFGVVCIAPAMAADPVAGACPKPGTVLQTSIPSTVTVLSADGLICTIRSSATGEGSLIGLVLRRGPQFEPPPEALAAVSGLWPLASGKSASYTLRIPNGGSWSEKYAVHSKRKVTVKAGAFEAFELVQTETGGEFEGIYDFYIAPDLGYIVKFRFRLTKGSPDRTPPDWELVSVKAP